MHVWTWLPVLGAIVAMPVFNNCSSQGLLLVEVLLVGATLHHGGDSVSAKRQQEGYF